MTRINRLAGKEVEPATLLETKIAGEIDEEYLSADKANDWSQWKPAALRRDEKRTIDWYRATSISLGE